jgi:uncharacterized membrane-anchored protein
VHPPRTSSPRHRAARSPSAAQARSAVQARPARGRQPVAAKVPEITALFWVIKIITTGMGEATSDYLAKTSVVLAGVAGLAGFALAMWLQFRVRRYLAVVYWLAVSMVAVFGTMAADGLHVELGIPYIGSTLIYAAALAVIFWRWHRSEGTLSIHSIVTRRREAYYWLTVLATFALGTATGDLTATTLHLGYLPSGLLFTGLILVPAAAWRWLRLNEIAAFWFAYVLTRPLGASFADYLSKPHAISGLNLGDGPVAAVAAVIIAALVGYVALARRDIQPALLPDAGAARTEVSAGDAGPA